MFLLNTSQPKLQRRLKIFLSHSIVELISDCRHRVDDPNARIAAFSVGLLADSNTAVDDVLIFDEILFNHGEHYDVSTGTFTCPTDGVYLFNLSARPANDNSGCEASSTFSHL